MPSDLSTLAGRGQTVCVTGAGGFIASWLVKLLLARGYTVRGTVRNPGPCFSPHTSLFCFILSNRLLSVDDPKNAHLRALEGAKERLALVKADLLDSDGLHVAINGCDGVFHTASPVTDEAVSRPPPIEEMIQPAIKGTWNVMNAAADAAVRRVVFTSSIGAVYMNPTRGLDAAVDESCWSDLDFCKVTEVHHHLLPGMT
ncbi:hypothetical protein BHE74_00028549 [Ensete ventricosum]|nr:hypothetical protein GW17_00009474 [Ensete ventricosum]RWW64218.1 hypothetical protein BHE74_00028549 [Ensete ventricosum]RZR81472.1 hypothetical protein BHM03_00007700 [Ensete ventricosum]